MASVSGYFSLIKFIHTVFALPFAIAGFTLAIMQPGQVFDFHILIAIILCMVFARTSAMAFNRWLDRNIDAMNPRTQNRELPAGKVKPGNALFLAVVSSVLFVVSAFIINPLCFYLSPVALFVILFYSYTKRFTWLCHWILGTGLSLSPVGAYIAVTGEFAIEPILLSVVVLMWVSGFDILYSIMDESFDKSNKLYSVPSVMGKKLSMVIAAVSHFLSLLVLLLLWDLTGNKYLFLAGIIIYSVLIFLEHYEIHSKGTKAIAPAFFRYNSWAGVLLCAGFIAGLFLF